MVERSDPAGVILKHIRPVISGMKRRRAEDTRFVELLDSMRLTVDPSPTRYPNAWAFDNEKTGAGISLDTWYISQQKSVASVVALLQVLQVPNQKLFERAMLDYLRACVDAKKTDNRAPELVINLQRYGVSDLMLVSLEPLIDDILKHFIAFVILHEIGHLYSGHAGKSFAVKSDSISAELEADLWALRTMREMDYSLGTLSLVFGVKQVMELSRTGSGFDIGSPKHPTWEQRLNQITAFNKQNPPRNTKWIALRGLSILASETLEVSYDLRVFVETQPTFEQLSRAVVSFLALDSRRSSLKPEHFMFNEAVAQWSDDTVIVRFRIDSRAYELNINDPMAHDQTGELSFESPDAHPKTTIPLRFDRFGHGLAAEERFKGMRLGELAEFDAIDFQIKTLSLLGVERSHIERASKSLKEHRKELLQLLLAYNTGELSRQELENRRDYLKDKWNIRIEDILGHDTYVRMQQALDDSIEGQVRHAIEDGR